MFPRSRSPRAGLTLIELVVVLVVLIALAGIIIPALPNMLTRAHTTAGATNTSELARSIQLYQSSLYKYPDNFDSLMNTSNALSAFLPGGATTPCGGDLTTFTLGANTLAALNGTGITTVWNIDDSGPTNNPGSFSPTFNPYPTTSVGTTLSTSTQVAILSPSGALHLNLVKPDASGNPPAATAVPVFVVLGVGRRSDLVGKTLTDPPTHFTDDPTQLPDTVYARFAVVFQVTRTTNTDADAQSAARFVATVSMHPNNVISTDGHLQEFYNLVRDGQ